MKPSELSFKTLCDFFEAVAKSPPRKKVLLLRRLLERNLERDSDDLYEAFRLIVPYRDNERANYELKEQKLVSALIKACSLDPKVNSSAQRALEWKKPTTKHAGNFPLVMEEYLLRTNCGKTANTDGEKELKIGTVNQKLDELAAASGNLKATVLASLMRATSPRLLKWIICIILKDLKIGMSENTVFKEYHEDGIKLFNKTMNMRQVVNELRDPHYRILNEDVEPGQPVRAQLAITMGGTKQIAQRMKGKAFVIETKFDGERMQVHKKNGEVRYYSRNGLDHGEQSGYTVFNAVLDEQITREQYILDCELVAWNKKDKRFEPFGGLKSAFNLANQAKAAGTRLEMTEVYRRSSVVEHDPDYEAPTLQDTEIICVAFDVLHDGRESVIHHSLVERHKILSEMIDDPTEVGVQLGESAAVGRVFPLVPYRRFLDGMAVSKVSRSEEDVQEAFENALKGQDEGIMVKDLDSRWVANDRKGAWMKLKPDHAFVSEIDAVIIGAHFGTGRRRGDIAEYLLALAEKPTLGHTKPTTFISMCRVGTGVSDEERKQISEKLQPLFIEANHRRPNNPKCYRVTGHAKERPDVWIKDPYQSIVLEVLADIRLITTSVFATQRSLRFPRVQKIRWDKGAADVQTHDDFLEQAEERREGPGEAWQGKQKRRKPAKPKEEKTPPKVATSAYLPVDVSAVQSKSDILKGAKLEVLSFGSGSRSKEAISKLIKELGGQMYMNMTPSVTHYLSESSSHYQVAIRVKKNYDVLALDWLLEVADAGKLIQPLPRHYIFLTKETRNQNPALDQFGDPYSIDSSVQDLRALVERHISTEQAAPSSLDSNNRSGPSMATDTVVSLEEELDSLGHPIPLASLFRGCKCVHLRPARDHAEENAGDELDLQSLRDGYLHSLVQLCGGLVTEAVGEDTTHVIVPPEFGDAKAVCQAVKAGGGIEALENLHSRCSKGLSLVLPSWVLQSFKRAAQLASEGQSVQRVAESSHTHPAAQNTRWTSWPWEDFGLDLKSKKRKAAADGVNSQQKRLKSATSKPIVRKPRQRQTRKGTLKVGGSRKQKGDAEEDAVSEVPSRKPLEARERSRRQTKNTSESETDSDKSEGQIRGLEQLQRGRMVVESSDSDACMDTADPQDEVASCHATSPEKARVEAKGSEAEARGQSNKGSIFEGSQAFGKPPGKRKRQLEPATRGDAAPKRPVSSLLKAQLSSSDDLGTPEPDPKLGTNSQDSSSHSKQGAAAKECRLSQDQPQKAQSAGFDSEEERAEESKDEAVGIRKDADAEGLGGDDVRKKGQAEEAGSGAGNPKKEETAVQRPLDKGTQEAAMSLGSQGLPPGKKLTLRERMALRGITAKK